MRRKTCRRLMSLVTAGAAALSLLFQGGTALAVSGGAEDAAAFSEQLSPSGAEPTGTDSGEAAQKAAVLDGTQQEEAQGEGVPGGPDADGDAQGGKRPEEGPPEVSNPEEGVSEKTVLDGDVQESMDSEKDEQDEADLDGDAQEGTDSEKDAQNEADSGGNALEGTDGEDGIQEEPSPNGEVLTGPALRATAFAERTSSGVAFEKTGDFAYNIYANGQPLLIEVSSFYEYSELYIDENRNGIGDQGEEITEFRGDATNGIYYLDNWGYFLRNTTIYGGGKDGECQYDTSVTLKAPQDMSDQSVMAIYGGSANGTLTGSTCVDIKGGIVWQVFGGNAEGVLDGNTCVNISGGGVTGEAYGGNKSGTLTGSGCVNIKGGSVWAAFGGNEEGTLDGNTCVSISGGTATNVYGGGNRAETNGNTSIYITGGHTDNIYGGSDTGQVNGNTLVDVKNAQVGSVFGGNKVSGKVTGDTKLVLGENAQATGWVYGGGEGNDGNAIVEVAGSTNIIVNGGTFAKIFGGGRRHATVGNSNITVNAGNISSYIYGGGEEASSVTGKASITVNGGSLYGVCASGASGTGTTVKDAEILLKNVEMQYFNCDSPVEGKLSVTFENASASTFLLARNAIDTAGATLSFINCGSADKGWTEQPEVGFQPNQNRFHTILMQNSYIRFRDDSTQNVSGINDCTLDGCTENLVLDGGALWVKGTVRFNMPVTEFRNQPLILRASGMAIHFDEVPNGTARIQWMNEDGTVPDNPRGQALVEAPTDTPDKTFVSGDARYGLKTDSIVQDNGIWRGKAWYVIDSATTCSCTLLSALLQEYVFPLSIDGERTVVTLKDVYEGSTAYSESCPVVEHDGTAVTAEYSLIAEGTTAKGASINGNQLTVEGMGSVHIMVRQQLNGKSREDDCYVQIMEFPESDNYTFTVGMIEKISFAFGEINAAGILNNAVLWSDTDNKYVDSANYSVTAEDNRVRFIIDKNYLEGLGLGEYGFRASIPYRDGEGKMSGYMYCFTVNIVPVIVVDDPVIELLEEPQHYDGKEKKPAVVVKDGDKVIPADEYEVSYANNTGVGTATITITDIAGGRYEVNGTREFEIVNEYAAENGTDYLAKLNDKGWINEDFIISAAEGHLLSTGNTLADEWTETLPPRTEETDSGSVTFYVKNIETGLISLAVTESYKLDRTAPEGADILFDGNSVKTELGNITFSGLFGKNVKVAVTAEDALSGIGDISYLQSEKILTQEELGTADGWIGGREFEISAEDGMKFVVYGKATDQADNTVFIASEGGEFDLKSPEISGIEPDGTYYVTQIASVTDAHLDTVTVNGEAVTEKVTLSGNREATYVIKALDRLGRETVVTVTMKPINSLAEPIEGLTEGNVAFDDAATILQVLEVAESIMTENAAAEEKEELQALIETCKSLYRKALADYRILEGDGSEWTQGTNGEITFRANGAFSKFVGILIDGQAVNPEGYTASEGSTVITLKKDLLGVLAVGTHSLTVLYSDGGQASAEFEITERDDTGEEDPSEPGGDDGGSVPPTPGPGGDDGGSVPPTPGPGGDDGGSVPPTPGPGGNGSGGGTETSGSESEASGIRTENLISPQTGDDSLFMPQQILWMLLAVGTLAVYYGIARNRRRK